MTKIIISYIQCLAKKLDFLGFFIQNDPRYYGRKPLKSYRTRAIINRTFSINRSRIITAKKERKNEFYNNDRSRYITAVTSSNIEQEKSVDF